LAEQQLLKLHVVGSTTIATPRNPLRPSFIYFKDLKLPGWLTSKELAVAEVMDY